MISELQNFLMQHELLTMAMLFALVALMAVEGWLFISKTRSISVPQAVKLINHQRAVILDLRTAALYHSAHIQRAIHLDAQAWEQKQALWKKQTASPVILITEGDLAVFKTEKQLKTLGFTDVFVLEQGMAAWLEAGFPTVSSK